MIFGNLIRSPRRAISYYIKTTWDFAYGDLAFLIDNKIDYNPFLKFVHKLM